MDFALSEATDDVAETIAWLTEEGFEVVNESGPPYLPSFGFLSSIYRGRDLSLHWSWIDAQWCIELGYLGEKREDLRVLMTAMDGTEAEDARQARRGGPVARSAVARRRVLGRMAPTVDRDWLATADRRGGTSSGPQRVGGRR
ncbi:MAG: hypothetical protein R2699_07115 [Acidimicrobiales bacterium]